MGDLGFRFFISRTFSALTLLVIVLLVNALEPGRLSPVPAAMVILAYALFNMTLYGVGVRRIYLLLILLDVLVVTLLIYVTGGYESRFQFLYLILVIYAGFFVQRDLLHLIAALAVVSYSIVLLLQFFHLIPSMGNVSITAADVSYVIGVNFVALLLVSLVVGLLATRIGRLTSQVEAREKSLRQMVRLKNRIVDAIPSALITTDADLRVTYFNHEARDFLLRHEMIMPDELMGQNLSKLFPVRELWDEDDPNVVQRVEYTFPNGIVIGMNLSRMFAEDRLTGVLMVFQDLTSLKAMERSVWFRNSLMSLGEMAAGIAHEIRNPLASVTGAVQLLKEQRTSSQDGELFAIIEDELERLRGTLQDFLSFTRDEQDEPVDTDLNALVVEVLNLFEKGKTDQVLLEADPGIYTNSLRVKCKRGKFKRVIWNLLKNAEKAVQYQEQQIIYVNLFAEGEELVLRIEDTGPGIQPDVMDRIFEPYFSTFAKGFGLGLSISKTIVEEIGGTIEAMNTEGGGARFLVKLPLSVEGQEA